MNTGRASDGNAGLSPQIVFLSLTWPILKEIPECESAALQRIIILAREPRATLFQMEIRRAAANSARKHEEHFIFEVRRSPRGGATGIYVADSYKIFAEEIFFTSHDSPRVAPARRINNYRWIRVGKGNPRREAHGGGCYPMINIGDKKCIHLDEATSEHSNCHYSASTVS